MLLNKLRKDYRWTYKSVWKHRTILDTAVTNSANCCTSPKVIECDLSIPVLHEQTWSLAQVFWCSAHLYYFAAMLMQKNMKLLKIKKRCKKYRIHPIKLRLVKVVRDTWLLTYLFFLNFYKLISTNIPSVDQKFIPYKLNRSDILKNLIRSVISLQSIENINDVTWQHCRHIHSTKSLAASSSDNISGPLLHNRSLHINSRHTQRLSWYYGKSE